MILVVFGFVSTIKEKQGTGNVARRSPAVNRQQDYSNKIQHKIQQQDPAQGIKHFLCSIDSNQEVGNSFDGIT